MKTGVFYAICGITIIVFLGDANGDKCLRNETTVPMNFKMEHAESYRFLESALQIYTELRIPCDGYLTEWRFLAGNPFIYALHLGIFRRRSVRPTLVFELVSESHLSAMSTPDGISGIWVYYPPNEPMPVKEGDLIGVFYDKFAISMEMLTIVNKNEVNIGKLEQAKTYVLLLDNLTLRKNKTIDASKAGISYRKPALSAIISPNRPGSTGEDFDSGDTSSDVDEGGLTTTSTSEKAMSATSDVIFGGGQHAHRAYRQTVTPMMPSTTMPPDEIICNGFLCWPSIDYL